MHIDVGDLVSIKHHAESENCLGIVVKKFNSNQGIEKSIHVKHIVDSFPPVFYVCSVDGNYQGPFLRSDLSLQQTCKNLNLGHDF